MKLQNGITCNNPKFVKAYSGDIFPIDINAYIHSDKENSFIEINNTLFSPDSCKSPEFPYQNLCSYRYNIKKWSNCT